MSLGTIDWILIVGYFGLTIAIALKFASRAGQNLGEFFLGGRKLTWYVAGVSMVATTFAADTPLAVTELTASNGISGNWLWWNMLIGGMLTTFFFARLWRRSGVLTEVEFINIRYSGIAARWLRGFKSIYLGLFLNVLILGWVNLAMQTIFMIFFDLSSQQALWYTAIAMAIVAGYSAISGFMGVAITDFVQFIIAMAGCIILSIVVVNSEEIGGITGLKEKLSESGAILNFFPEIGAGSVSAGILAITTGAFIAYIGFQWWASWYPGNEPGGGGFIAQRMMSTKTEKDSFWATLFFQVAHYAIRPWPWIITALCAVVLYSIHSVDNLDPAIAEEILRLKAAGIKLEKLGEHLPLIVARMKVDPELAKAVTFTFDPRVGYVYAMRDFLPEGLRGLLLVAFLAAYMSTVSTQLNWGASYLLNDLYQPFVRPGKSEKHYVLASRIMTIVLMGIAIWVTTRIESISGVWNFLIGCGAGLGMVLILRWYWWRINAWSEIIAALAPFLAFGFVTGLLPGLLTGGADPLEWTDDQKEQVVKWTEFPGNYFLTVGFTTLAWLVATFVTKPESSETLRSFYARVNPGGIWGIYRIYSKESVKGKMFRNFMGWILGVVLVYSALFATGKLLFQEWQEFAVWFIAMLVSGVLLWKVMRSD